MAFLNKGYFSSSGFLKSIGECTANGYLYKYFVCSGRKSQIVFVPSNWVKKLGKSLYHNVILLYFLLLRKITFSNIYKTP